VTKRRASGTGGKPLALAIVVLLVVGATACGMREIDSTAPPPIKPTPFPVTVEAANGDIRIEEQPNRIVSLSPSVTEMLYAMGAGELIVAADEYSNYPADAPATKLSGFEPNVEAIVKFEPELVVISEDRGDLNRALEAVGIPLLVTPSAESLEDTYDEIRELGQATGHAAEAADLVDSIKDDLDRLSESVPEFDEPLTYYHELTETFYSATSKTFIGRIYGMVGLHNIADEARVSGTEYPQLSAEYIIDADPDIIFLADTKHGRGQSVETVASRPGWDQISAVKTGAVVELDDDIASRWGPRIVDFLEVVVEAVSDLKAEGD
jgi:iron complex transport system substrate-binding protein